MNRSRLSDWGRLLRISLAPTALADVLCGLTLVARGWPPPLALGAALAASACVYHGGMLLNDWADRDRDARERPGRPLPSGRIAARPAALAALALLAAGPALALLASPASALCLAAVALAAALYDLAARGAWLGPALLGLCRAGNLASGALLGLACEPRASWPLAPALIALAYGGYVFAVGRLARLEDGADTRFERAELALGALCALLALAPVLAWLAADTRAPALDAWSLARVLALALAGGSALGLWRGARALRPWTRAGIEAAVGMALRRMLVFTASAALVQAHALAAVSALAILCGYPLAFLLRRRFPPS